MDTPSRNDDSPLAESVESRLWKEPYHFEFFQAVRLLGKIQASRKMVGGSAKPSEEIARFGINPSVVFPASEIQSLERGIDDSPPRMVVNFLGLTGPQGVLPHVYTKAVMERTRARNNALRDFLDIFNHRILSLFYRAWEQYHFQVSHERGVHDGFSQYLLSLIGWSGKAAIQNEVFSGSILYYAGLLAQHPRSANALRKILVDYFEVPVEVEQFVGAWYKVDESTQCVLGDGNGERQDLGGATVVGDEFWDVQGRVRIKLGPLKIAAYRNFLPGGSSYEPLRSVTRVFSCGQLDFEVQLVLLQEDVPACRLEAEDSDEQPLGWLTCVKSETVREDPDEFPLSVGRRENLPSTFSTVLRL